MVIRNQYQKIVPFIIFILGILLLFKLIEPMINILLGSIILTFISFPLYQKVIKKIQHKSLSIIISLLIVLIIILIPFTFLAFEIGQQGYLFYNSLSNNIAKGALFGFGCDSEESILCLLLNQAEKLSVDEFSKYGIDKQLKEFLPIMEKKIADYLFNIPIMFVKLFLVLIISYYFLLDLDNILKNIVEFLPMRKKTISRLMEQFVNISNTVIYAQLFVVFVQGVIATIGYYVFGAPFALIFGVLTAIFALVPTFGTAVVWIPISLFLILRGYFSQDYFALGKGIGMFIYGLLIISVIDNILLARIVNSKTRINQITVIVGVIGGTGLFGVIGIFVGPILLPLILTYFETFKERFV